MIDRLPRELREQLAFRTYFVFESDERLLPIAAMKMGAQELWPATPEEIADIASKLAATTIESGKHTQWILFFNSLVLASRAAHLARLRAQAGQKPNIGLFRVRYASAEHHLADLDERLRPEAERLLLRVKGELSGPGPTLAEEMYRAVTRNELSDDVGAMNTTALSAFSMDM